MNHSTPLTVLLLFFVSATWGLWWWWFQDLTVDLLSTTVDWTLIVALHVFVSDMHHRAFSTLKCILCLFAHLRLLMFSWSSVISSGFPALWLSLVSSTNLDIWDNQFQIHLAASQWMPSSLTFTISLSCGTLSSAF